MPDRIKVTYTGPFESVHLPALNVTATRGKAIEVPTAHGENLIAQGWKAPRGWKPADDKGEN